jgi:hypothetical protein
VAGSCTLAGIALRDFPVIPLSHWLGLRALGVGAGCGAVDICTSPFLAARDTSNHMNGLQGFRLLGTSASPLLMGTHLWWSFVAGSAFVTPHS